MLIHLSVLAVMIFVSLCFERRQRDWAITLSERKQPFKTSLLPWLIVIGYIVFLAAMRSRANDTRAYINGFNNLEPSTQALKICLSQAKLGEDWAFNAVSILFKTYISENYHLWLGFYALVQGASLIYVLRRNAVSLWECLFFMFSSTIYGNFFTMMRQWTAITVLFACSELLTEKKYVKYIIACLIMAQFHASAIIMIPVCLLTQGKAWSKKQVAIIIGAFAGLIFLNPLLAFLENSAEGTTYDYAINAMNSDSGSSIVRAFIAVVPVILSYICKDEIDPKNKMINLCINMSLLNFLLNTVASFTSGLYVVRLSGYMNVFNLILYPYLLDVALVKKNMKFVKAFYYVFYLMFYFYQNIHQGSFFYASDILGTFY